VRGNIGPFSPCSTALRVDSQGLRVTSGGGLILVRKLNERRDFSELVEPQLTN
jgi:hypothetical protein